MRQEFDPTDPSERAADRLRKKVAELALDALSDPDYASLSPTQQIACFMAGVSTGLVGVCLAQMRPEGHDDMMAAIANYLPDARQQAESIIESQTH